MKAIKKMLSFMLAVVMMMAMTVTAGAAGTHSITIKGGQGTYVAYQILTGEAGENGKLTKIAKGSDVSDSILDGKTVDEYALSLQDQNGEEVAKAVKAHVTGAGVTGTPSGNDIVISGLATGYYLVENTATPSVHSAYIVEVVTGNVEVNPKNTEIPTLKKEIQHNEKANDANQGWGKVGDNQIGDTVNFKITSTVPSAETLAKYDKYIYQINDRMDSELAFNEGSVQITYANANGETVTLDSTKYTLTKVVGGFNIKIDVKAAELGDKTLTTTYSATLTDEAKIYTNANGEKQQNEAWLTYSNNPYDSATGTPETTEGGDGDSVTETPHDKVYDWTFVVPVQKYIAGSTTPQAGAEFKLTKGDSTEAIAFVKTTDNAGNAIYTVADDTATNTTTTMVTPSTGKIIIKGLDDTVTYTLTETAAPEGYTLAAPVAITITAEYNEAGDECTTMKINNEADGAVVVYNKAGATLPSTGGMGTTVFNVVGGMLMVIAAVLLITRKRLSVNR